MGGWRGRNRQPGGLSGLGADSRAGHARAASQIHAVGRAASAGRRSQTLAGSILPDRAHPLCRRGYRHAQRKNPHRRMERRRRADAASGKARALHHQYRVCQFCDGGGGFRRRADQGKLHGDPGRRRSRNIRSRHAHAKAGASAFFDRRSDFQPAHSGQQNCRRLRSERWRHRAALQPQRDH